MATVAGDDIGLAVTVLEADGGLASARISIGSSTIGGIGVMLEGTLARVNTELHRQRRDRRRSTRTRVRLVSRDRWCRPFGIVPQGRGLARHGRRALLGASFRPFLHYYVVRCIVNASRTAATA
jgi:hypothetical protein